MYLRKLELQGFKTFAVKTALEFHPDANGRRGLTGVVGPNGSGKSNVADAIRWVMGEQSMKLLRSKKSEDVIFSGSDKKSRSGFAEVSLTLVNDDHASEIELPEIVVTRRLYRDGQSEYEINKKAARLTDVTLLLAQCGVGQRTYSVIGQGMVDAVLSASPAERREFFDEAAGLKPFQLKRHSSMNKLDGTRDNLAQADTLMREIAPRLSSLERQVKRLRERETLEAELKTVERAYFGGMWAEIRTKLRTAGTQVETARAAYEGKNAEAAKLEQELTAMEKATPVSDELRKIRAELDALREERGKLRERQIRLESEREVAKVKAQKPWSPLPLSKIINEIESLGGVQKELLEALEAKTPDISKLKTLAAKLRDRNTDLLSKLQRTAPEETTAAKDPKLETAFAELAEETATLADRIADAEARLKQATSKEDENRAHLFQLQRDISARRHEAQASERTLSEASVDVARLETRRDGLFSEVRTLASHLESELDVLADAKPSGDEAPDKLQARMTKLRSQLEWIGGIDPETMKEYEETKARFEQLQQQTDDLKEAMRSLETIITELDKTIAERADVAFRQLDREFGQYFQKLFGGGEARIIKVEPEVEEEEAEDGDGNGSGNREQEAGIDIQATPPGKRLKATALLSGGERALTSIALICAIMAINPSPFVVLDEVDAALDEANSRKFAEIVDSLVDRTQFIVITHNRATMNKANVLYGVTMGEDGVSQILSVKLEGLPFAVK